MSNKAKSEFLGMPFGTANNRLRKALIFKMAQKLGWDKCCRCSGVIANLDELSIEHKEPWLHKSVELFWDLDNIGFSHMRCNVRGFEDDVRRNVAPDGMAWCNGHGDYIAIENFQRCTSRWNGLQQKCRECRKVYG